MKWKETIRMHDDICCLLVWVVSAQRNYLTHFTALFDVITVAAVHSGSYPLSLWIEPRSSTCYTAALLSVSTLHFSNLTPHSCFVNFYASFSLISPLFHQYSFLLSLLCSTFLWCFYLSKSYDIASLLFLMKRCIFQIILSYRRFLRIRHSVRW